MRQFRGVGFHSYNMLQTVIIVGIVWFGGLDTSARCRGVPTWIEGLCIAITHAG